MISRFRTLSFIRTSTTLTSQSGPGYVCSIRPSFQQQMNAKLNFFIAFGKFVIKSAQFKFFVLLQSFQLQEIQF